MMMCDCWTSGYNRIRVVVHGAPVLHYPPCTELPLLLKCGCQLDEPATKEEIAEHIENCPHREVVN